MKCIRCQRETKHSVAGLGPTCARRMRVELGLRVRRREPQQLREVDTRQVDWLNQEAAA